MTTLDISLKEIEESKDRLAINVHKSAADSAVYTACGDLPVGMAAGGAVKVSGTPAPTSNPGSDNAGQGGAMKETGNNKSGSVKNPKSY